MTLEKMGEFFDSRLDGYEAHQLGCIDSATAFYPYTAALLPAFPGCRVLDLGCGTGLELSAYFALNPLARVTGIDLAGGMLHALRMKFPDKPLTLVQGSYFDVPFGQACYDAAVSVESLHHFPLAQKIPLYERLCAALKDGGYFVLTDYMASDDAEEALHFSELDQLRQAQRLCDGELYHYDTPLTRAHETEALLAGGFARVEFLRQWKNTVTLKAYRSPRNGAPPSP
mgnify:CR=1 FL=1